MIQESYNINLRRVCTWCGNEYRAYPTQSGDLCPNCAQAQRIMASAMRVVCKVGCVASVALVAIALVRMGLGFSKITPGLLQIAAEGVLYAYFNHKQKGDENE